MLSRLSAKGLARHRYDGPRYVFETTEDSSSAGSSALREVVDTFFRGSNSEALGALLALSKDSVDDDELKHLEAMVATTRRKRNDDA